MQRGSKLIVAMIALAASGRAFAGGFEYPDNGTEALGRGATFTAKADSPLALLYNVGGLARQRGTRIELDMNLSFQKLDFQRAGVYPGDPTDPATPYAGQPFPKVSNKAGPMFAPGIYISSDFGYFDRWTFGIGLFGPSSIGNRDFGTTVKVGNQTLPSPARYDIVKENLLIFYPTIAAAVRATRWLSIGAAVHVVYGHLQLTSTSYVDLNNVCPRDKPEYQPCDTTLKLDVTAVTATASLGMLFTPRKDLSIGFNLRGPAFMKAHGSANSTPPALIPMDIAPGKATFQTNLPFVLRLGLRYAFLKDGFEQGDIELDGTYESWGYVQGKGPKLYIPQLSVFSDINVQIDHHYVDTFSLRLGGAYNLKVPKEAGVFTVRLGTYYDSPASTPAWTRVNFDTLAKIGLTLGLGYKWRGLVVNLAYAYVFSPDRHVTDGELRPINSTDGSNGNSSGPYMPINNGLYQIGTHVASLGLQFLIEDFYKTKKRVIKYE